MWSHSCRACDDAGAARLACHHRRPMAPLTVASVALRLRARAHVLHECLGRSARGLSVLVEPPSSLMAIAARTSCSASLASSPHPSRAARAARWWPSTRGHGGRLYRSAYEARGARAVSGFHPSRGLASAATVNAGFVLIARPARASGAYSRALSRRRPSGSARVASSGWPLTRWRSVDARVVSCVEGLCRP